MSAVQESGRSNLTLSGTVLGNWDRESQNKMFYKGTLLKLNAFKKKCWVHYNVYNGLRTVPDKTQSTKVKSIFENSLKLAKV